jgi:magnesium transporter
MTTLRWTDGDKTLVGQDASVLPELLARKEGLLWLDLEAPGEEERALLHDVFSFHPLAIEDALNPVQRPKLDEYEGGFFFVTYEVDYAPASDPELGLRTGQVGIFARSNAIVTVHMAPSETIRQMHERCDEHNTVMHRGADYLLYALLDTLVDRYFPILDVLDDQMDDLEDRVVKEPRREVLDTIFALKRTLLHLRKIAAPTRDALTALTTREFPVIREELLPYFRDVSDHLIRIYEILDSYRDMMSGALDAYLSNVSNQMNQVMERLTIVAVIFLPLTFITGVFGMNFRTQPWMPSWDRGQMFWLTMGAMALIGGAMAWLFRRKQLL